MKLGNIGGKNLGKKYLKIKGDEPITQNNQIKADDFKIWFGKTYTGLQTELINKDTYNEDILNDTFLRIYDKIRFGGLDIRDYKSYFHRAFFTNFMQFTIAESKGIITILESNEIVDDTNSDLEYILFQEDLGKEILNYVDSKYPNQEAKLFNNYVKQNTKISLVRFSEISSIPLPIVIKTISKIRKDIKNHDHFMCKRNSMKHIDRQPF